MDLTKHVMQCTDNCVDGMLEIQNDYPGFVKKKAEQTEN